MPTPLSVSVVIRNRNEAASLQLVLRALALQDGPPAELVIVDNESSDASREVARDAGARIINLPKAEFTYGRALNLGIEHATGALIVVLSAHSLPLGRHFLQDAREPFRDDRVAAVRCIHLGKTREVRSWMEPGELTASDDVRTVISRGPIASGCVLRRSVWESTRFDEQMEAAEDKQWAARVLEAGYVIRRCEAMYYYLRVKTPSEEIRQATREDLAMYRWKNIPTNARLLDVVRSVFIGAPASALRIAGASVYRYLQKKSVPFKARGKARVGSLR